MAMINSEPKGPRPLTQDDIDKTKHELKTLDEQRTKLKEEYHQLSESRKVELDEAKRTASECRKQVGDIKTEFSNKLAQLKCEHEQIRREDADKVAAYLKRINADEEKIRALEREVVGLRSQLTTESAAHTDQALASPEDVSSPDSLPAFLRRLGLEAYQPRLEEEELDVALLRSMEPEVMKMSMAEVGMSKQQIDRMISALF